MKIKHPMVVVYGILGLIFVGLGFFIHYLFMIPAAILSAMGWKVMGRKRIE